MGGSVIKSHLYLRPTHRVSEWTASRNDYDPAGARRQGFDPILQIIRIGETAAELDHDRTITRHLCCRFRIGFDACGIEMTNFRHVRAFAAHDLNAGAARPDFELFHADNHAGHARMT